MADSFETLRSAAALLGGTILLRPYVAAFLAVFLVAAARDLGALRAVGFLLWGGFVSLGAELSSTRVGFPFGLYHYTGETVGAEIYFSNVPLFSTLSFPFLAYASFCLARAALGPQWADRRARRLGVVALAGVLMTLLDVVIDPLAVLGERWFLGHVFFYPEGGVYFGVPLSNFGGWLLVGWATVGGYVLATGDRRPGSVRSGIALYYAILAFNLGVALWIGEPLVAAVGIVVHLGTFLLLYIPDRVAPGRWSAARLSTTR